MQAILWDGRKQLIGKFEFEYESFSFIISDFIESNIKILLHYSQIENVERTKIYGVKANAMQINMKNKARYLFVVENETALLKLMNHIQHFTID